MLISDSIFLSFFFFFFPPSQVSEKYCETHRKMTSEVVKSYLPFPWISMAQTKQYFYKGLAHYYVAMALLEQKGEILCDLCTANH